MRKTFYLGKRFTLVAGPKTNCQLKTNCLTCSPVYNERELIARIASGDEHAFQQFFHSYRDRLYHYIAGFVKSQAIAEELVMDVFMKIWIGRELAVQIEDLDAFLFRIAHNKSIDFLRAAARDQQLKKMLWERVQVESGILPETAMMVREYEGKIREAISLLSPQRKKAYLLSREQDLSHDQIAAQLNISKATVNNLIVEAQRFIRNYLAKSLDIAVVILLAGKI